MAMPAMTIFDRPGLVAPWIKHRSKCSIKELHDANLGAEGLRTPVGRRLVACNLDFVLQRAQFASARKEPEEAAAQAAQEAAAKQVSVSRDPAAAAPSSTLLPPTVSAAGAGAADLGTAATRSPTARRLAVGEPKTPLASPLVLEGPVHLVPRLPWEHASAQKS